MWETGVLKERWCLGDGGVRETLMVQQMLRSAGQRCSGDGGVQESVCSGDGALGGCPSVRRV